MTPSFETLLKSARRHAASSAIVESLVFTKRWAVGDHAPDLARAFPFRLDVDARGDAAVSVRGRRLPIESLDLVRRFGAAAVELQPGMRMLLTAELAAEIIDGALTRIERERIRFDWELASFNLRLSFALPPQEVQLRHAIERVERAIAGLRWSRALLASARGAVKPPRAVA